MQDLLQKNASRLEWSIRFLDITVIGLAGKLAGFIRFSSSLDAVGPIHLVLLYFCSVLAFLLFYQFGMYKSWRGRSVPAMYFQLAGTWGLVLLCGLVFSFLINHVGELSRLWLFYWFLIGASFLVLVRWFIYSMLRTVRKSGMNSKRVVIVGYGRIGQEIHKRALRQDWFGYEVKAVQAEADEAKNIQSTTVTHLNSIDDIPEFVANNNIDEIWIALSLSASNQLQKLQYQLRNMLVDIRWIPDTLGIQMLSHKVGDFMGFPAVDLNRPVSSGLNGIAKELFDKIFSFIVLILLTPLFIVIGIGIKLTSPGPIFFKQPRHGLNGKKFNVYKFRSMNVHQENVSNGTVTQAKKNDARTTPFGRFLRRTSLDELPQFINVLIGDMSIVGPRPHALQHNEMYKDRLDLYMLRHRVKPGITGWAQIHGYRGETDTIDKMEKRVQFDLYYIKNWSLWMDIRIILWTAFKGWTGNNAY
ncbi:MAG: undecaprenyl-phosphate glucose phosphotransferase [Burkholderiaceae bacterium]